MRIQSAVMTISLVAVSILVAGCKGPESKLGRGIHNMTEFTRLGEMNRSVEQTSLFESPEVAYTTGVIRGFDNSVKRTVVGLYEVVTFPIPNHKHADYGPVMEPAYAVYPDSYTPGMFADQVVSPDVNLGFTDGGDVVPFVPNSRFRVFDN